MYKLPKISIVVVTLNNQRTLEECVKRIKEQDYPKELIEYLNIDGGSTDNTTSILKQYGFIVVKSYIKKDAEAQRSIGIVRAKHNLIVSIDADNYLSTNQWLKQMIAPFIEDKEVIHANTMHYQYKKDAEFFNRYTALFGTADPIAYYVGKPDRVAQTQKIWTRGRIIKETKNHYIVEFNKETLPTVGCNGVVYRKDILLKYTKSDYKKFLHIDVFADAIDKRFIRFAIVKNDIFHDTAVTLGLLMKKRLAFLSSYYLRPSVERRYLIYNPKRLSDNLRLFLFILYTITFIKPLLDSIRGYLLIRDSAWFAHPLVCWVYLYTYSLSTVKNVMKAHR